jgi:hypothetical protein
MVYLRSHAPDEVGRIDPESRTNTTDARVAVKAYRELLARCHCAFWRETQAFRATMGI